MAIDVQRRGKGALFILISMTCLIVNTFLTGTTTTIVSVDSSNTVGDLPYWMNQISGRINITEALDTDNTTVTFAGDIDSGIHSPGNSSREDESFAAIPSTEHHNETGGLNNEDPIIIATTTHGSLRLNVEMTKTSVDIPIPVSVTNNTIPHDHTACPNGVKWTCNKKFDKHPNLVQECIQNPKQGTCNKRCVNLDHDIHYNDTISYITQLIAYQDYYLRKNNYTHHTTSNNIWPPLPTENYFKETAKTSTISRWTDDIDYCANTSNTAVECLFHKYRYVTPGFEYPYTNNEACTILQDNNVSSIIVVGDSFGRHIAIAMDLILTGNNVSSLYCQSHRKECCDPDNQFASKECRGRNHVKNLCGSNSNITIEFYPDKEVKHTIFPQPDPNGTTLYIYSGGNHPGNGDYTTTDGQIHKFNVDSYKSYRWGMITNASTNFLRNPTTTKNDEDDDNKVLFMWVPPHARIKSHNAFESNERVFDFMMESSDFFASTAGGIQTVNTFSMALEANQRFIDLIKPKGQSLTFVSKETCQPMDTKSYYSYDGVHFGRIMNLWKANLILQQFVRLTS